MEGIVLAANGPVGERCAKMLDDLGIRYDRWPQKKSGALLISVHWRHIFTAAELSRFTMGGINVHNSYLPWNRGADACSWAIAENTPHGATVHLMTPKVDCGDFVYRERLELLPDETAHELYQRTADLEVKLFKKAMSYIANYGYVSNLSMGYVHEGYGHEGSYHSKADFQRLVRAVSTRDYQVVKREV